MRCIWNVWCHIWHSVMALNGYSHYSRLISSPPPLAPFQTAAYEDGNALEEVSLCCTLGSVGGEGEERYD